MCYTRQYKNIKSIKINSLKESDDKHYESEKSYMRQLLRKG